jgi:tetrahydromethanopterin S-methyltransferase subunit F
MWLKAKIDKLNQNEISYPAMTEKTRQMLVESLMDDIRKTSTLIGRDLRHWIKDV